MKKINGVFKKMKEKQVVLMNKIEDAAQLGYTRIQRFGNEQRGDMITGFIIGGIIVVALGVILYLAFKDTLIPMMLDKLKGKVNTIE